MIFAADEAVWADGGSLVGSPTRFSTSSISALRRSPSLSTISISSPSSADISACPNGDASDTFPLSESFSPKVSSKQNRFPVSRYEIMTLSPTQTPKVFREYATTFATMKVLCGWKLSGWTNRSRRIKSAAARPKVLISVPRHSLLAPRKPSHQAEAGGEE